MWHAPSLYTISLASFSSAEFIPRSSSIVPVPCYKYCKYRGRHKYRVGAGVQKLCRRRTEPYIDRRTEVSRDRPSEILYRGRTERRTEAHRAIYRDRTDTGAEPDKGRDANRHLVDSQSNADTPTMLSLIGPIQRPNRRVLNFSIPRFLCTCVSEQYHICHLYCYAFEVSMYFKPTF